MAISKTVVQSTLLLAFWPMLCGCDKIQDIDQLKSDMVANKQQVVLLRAELAAVGSRVSALEAVPKRTATNEGPAPLPQEQIAGLEKVIAQCVQFVRTSGPAGEEHFYVGFDAYYNPGAGRVMNNVRLVGEQPALYAFQKCMTSKGFPLT